MIKRTARTLDIDKISESKKAMMAEIAARLRAAAQVVAAMPPVGPADVRALWPEYIHGIDDDIKPVQPKWKPTPHDISMMDQAVEWLRILDPLDSRILWHRANGMPVKIISAKYNMSRPTIWRRWTFGLYRLADNVSNVSIKMIL